MQIGDLVVWIRGSESGTIGVIMEVYERGFTVWWIDGLVEDYGYWDDLSLYIRKLEVL